MVEQLRQRFGMAALAYATVCVVWGSTYLAIRVGVQDLPPALFASFRFLTAGVILFAITRVARQRLPARGADWGTHIGAGILMLGVAAGMVFWAEQFVDSGVTAIFIVTVSLWMALFDAVIPGSRARVTWLQAVGLFVGLTGTVLLVGADLEELRRADWRGPIALTSASAFWAIGSILLQRRPSASGPYVNSSIHMVAGGVFLLLIGTIRGEWAVLSFTPAGVGALVYLITFGSIVGFTAYVYVLQHWPATVAGTYVYVNTVVAVFLGWLILSEPVTARTFVSMAVILAAVVWVKKGERAGWREGGPGEQPRPTGPSVRRSAEKGVAA